MPLIALCFDLGADGAVVCVMQLVMFVDREIAVGQRVADLNVAVRAVWLYHQIGIQAGHHNDAVNDAEACMSELLAVILPQGLRAADAEVGYRMILGAEVLLDEKISTTSVMR